MNNKIFVVTRFNVGIHSHGVDYFSQACGTELITEAHAWSKYRLKVFSICLLASLAQQTYKKYDLVVIVDSNTPQDILEELNRILLAHNNLGEREVIKTSEPFLDLWKTDEYGAIAWMQARIPEATAHVVTLSLDTDTAINKTALENFSQVNVSEPTVFDTSVHWRATLYPTSGGLHYEHISNEYVSSQYAVVFPTSGRPRWIMEDKHWELFELPIQHTTWFTGIQFVHNSNIFVRKQKTSGCVIQVDSQFGIRRYTLLLEEFGVCPNLQEVVA